MSWEIWTPRSFSSLTDWSNCSLMKYSYSLLPWPRCMNLHFDLLNGISPCQTIQSVAAGPVGEVYCPEYYLPLFAFPTSLLSSANLKTELTKPESKSLMNIKKRMGPSTEPWGTPLVTNFHVELWPRTDTRWLRPVADPGGGWGDASPHRRSGI